LKSRTVPPSSPSLPHIDRKDRFQLPLKNEAKSEGQSGEKKGKSGRIELTTRNEDSGPLETFGSVDGRDDNFLRSGNEGGKR